MRVTFSCFKQNWNASTNISKNTTKHEFYITHVLYLYIISFRHNQLNAQCFFVICIKITKSSISQSLQRHRQGVSRIFNICVQTPSEIGANIFILTIYTHCFRSECEM